MKNSNNIGNIVLEEEDIMKQNLKKMAPFLVCLIIAFIFLTIGSKNSFLYRINDWYDANAFFTVGKSMFSGLVPYQDLFEQKGPLLYLIYGIGSLISKTSFIGVFLIEVIFFSVFLFYAKKTMELFLSEKSSYLGIILLALSIITLKPFYHGGSAEEFILPLFMISIYYFANYLKNPKNDILNSKQLLFVGILAGCAFWIKYTFLSFWFIWAIYYLFILINKKQYQQIIKSALIFLSGMVIASVPWLIYFIINGALKDFIDVYIIVNITAYPKINGFGAKIMIAISLLFLNLISNPAYLLFIFIPIIFLFFNRKMKFNNIIILIFMIVFTGLGAFIGGTNYAYYGLVLAPFNIIGIIIILSILEKNKLKINNIIIALALIISTILAFDISPNTKMMFLPKEEYAQFVFANIIDSEEDKTLLNYNFLDGGFYLTTDTIPECYYFMRNNILEKNYPEMMKTQRNHVRQRRPHFIVAKRKDGLLEKDYLLIKQKSQHYQGKKVTYYLYQRKNNR